MKRLCELLENSAQEYPYKIALITDEGWFTYSQLSKERDCISAYMQACGIRDGDRIILLLSHCRFLISSIFAASKVGATYILLHESITKYQLEYIIKDSQAAYLLTTDDFYVELELASVKGIKVILERTVAADEPCQDIQNVQVQQGGSSNEIACLLYTSGSTGRPKAVVCHHANILFVLESILSCLRIDGKDVIGNFLPLSFDYGMYQVFLAFRKGATLALGQRADIGPVLIQKLKQWSITGLPIVPSMGEALIKLMKRRTVHLPALRFITNTGAAFPQIYLEGLRKFFPDCLVYLMYGLTECKRVSILQPEYLNTKPNSVGTPLPGTRCTVVDEKGLPLPPYQVGELVVHGPHVMMGYLNDKQRTEQFFREMGSLGRSLYTGDYFWMDDEGFLYFHARKDDMFKQNGFRISPTEIELAAVDIDGVEQAALVLVGNPRVPILVAKSVLDSDRINEELGRRLEDYKMPKHIYVTNKLPLSVNGKIDKNKLLDDIKKE